jgi:hypothetical protein
MKSRWLVLIAIVTLGMSACAQQLPSGAMEYSTAFEREIPTGQALPGTDIQYLGKTDQGAQMSIGGQATLKQTLDSLTWRGEPVPGVSANYNLRIINKVKPFPAQRSRMTARHRTAPSSAALKGTRSGKRLTRLRG